MHIFATVNNLENIIDRTVFYPHGMPVEQAPSEHTLEVDSYIHAAAPHSVKLPQDIPGYSRKEFRDVFLNPKDIFYINHFMALVPRWHLYPCRYLRETLAVKKKKSGGKLAKFVSRNRLSTF